MNRPRPLLRALLALTLAGTLAASAHAYPPREWRFKVLLDDKPIGHHVYRLSLDHGQQVLKSEAEFGVTFLGFNAYRYQHVAVERWEGGCLQTIESRTNDNGEELAVSGRKTDSGFVLEGPRGGSALPSCVMSFAYWNPDILKQTRLLNAQNGEYLPVQVQSLGTESLALADSNIAARRYRLISSKFSIDLWYGSKDQWLALETRTEGGRMLRYEITHPYYSLLGNKRYG